MFLNNRSWNLCSFVFLITFLSSTAFFCHNLTSIEDKDTPCFLEPPTTNPTFLRTSSNSLVLPCHVARSKRATVEWWYTDLLKAVNIKIYPAYPTVRPTALRFVTSLTPLSKHLNETDIIDASVLLPYINVDDSGTYRCVIRPWSMNPMEQMENMLFGDESKVPSLTYNLQLTGPRLCHTSPSVLPCFTAMRTSSPTIVEAYQTAFLQCVIKSFNRPVNVFWVVGDAPVNSLLITNYLPSSQYNGDRLRRVFPRSLADYSIELSIDRNVHERVYSCVIDGTTDMETTIFTYIVRALDIEAVSNKTVNPTSHIHKTSTHEPVVVDQTHSSAGKNKVTNDDDLTEEDLFEAKREQEETSTTI